MKKILLMMLVAAMLVGCNSATETVATQAATDDREPEIELEDTSLGNVIPEIIPGPGDDPIPLGIPYPTNEEDKPNPLFLYALPEYYNYINGVYKIDGSDAGYVIHVKNYWMEISFKGDYGPVWKYTSFSEGELVAVTPKHFIFKLDSGLFYIEQESVNGGRKCKFEDLPKEERDFIQEVHKDERGYICPKSIQIDGFEYVDVEITGGVATVDLTERNYGRKESINVTTPEWFQFRDGRLFFVQPLEGLRKEAVFIGGIDGMIQVIHIPFRGEFERADEYGIFYRRNGEDFFKPYRPILVNGEMVFSEYSAEILENEGVAFPSERNHTSIQESIHADMLAPF